MDVADPLELGTVGARIETLDVIFDKSEVVGEFVAKQVFEDAILGGVHQAFMYADRAVAWVEIAQPFGIIDRYEQNGPGITVRGLEPGTSDLDAEVFAQDRLCLDAESVEERFDAGREDAQGEYPLCSRVDSIPSGEVWSKAAGSRRWWRRKSFRQPVSGMKLYIGIIHVNRILPEMNLTDEASSPGN